jgi:hypothetical protein
VRWTIGQYKFVPLAERDDGREIEFLDVAEACAFIRSLLKGDSEVRALRTFAREEQMPDRLSDEELISWLAMQVVNETYQVLDFGGRKHGTPPAPLLPLVVMPNRPAKAVPKEQAQVNAWVEFEVLWEDSLEPVADIALDVVDSEGKISSGQTGSSGRVRVDGLAEGPVQLLSESSGTLKSDTPTFVSMSELPSGPWFDVELVDTKGRPVPNLRYQIRIKEKTVKEGTLDAKGRARVSGLKEGDYEVCFPDLDEAVWKRA